MLDSELNKERDLLREQIEELSVKAEELRRKETRLRHVEALLGIEGDGINGAEDDQSKGINWADCCREYGLSPGGDSGHRVLKRLKPEIHASIPHVCIIDTRIYD